MGQTISHSFSRRGFLQTAAFSATAIALRGQTIIGANNQVRIGLIGCGRRGGALASQFAGLKNVRIVAVSDPDTQHMDKVSESLKNQQGGEKPVQFQDYRKLLETKDIDAVLIASPHHWHALHTIHACQAGMDVYVEKPMSHGVWEGKQMIAAAKQAKRIVQVGSQNRSDRGLIKAFDFIQQGKIGKITEVRGLCYRNRKSIGKIDTPLTPPSSLDYNLWLGPAQDIPLYRPQLHYDWHWAFNTGNGDLGNQGPHELDLISWVLGDPPLPTEMRTFGGRFGWDDGGETPNIQTAWFSLNDVPVIFEVNDLWRRPDLNSAVTYKSVRVGVIITCEQGEFRGGRGGGYIVGPDGKTKLKKFPGDAGGHHAQNFIDVVRSRRNEDLRAPLDHAHRSASLAHLANASFLCGKTVSTDPLREALPGSPKLQEVIDRQEQQLKDWKIDTLKTPYTLGPTVTVDPKTETIIGPEPAKAHYRRDCRKEFVIPELA